MFLDNEKVAKYSKRVANPISVNKVKPNNLVTLWSPLEAIKRVRTLNLDSTTKIVLLYAILKCSVLKESQVPTIKDICYDMLLKKEEVEDSIELLKIYNFLTKEGTWGGDILQNITTKYTLEETKKILNSNL